MVALLAAVFLVEENLRGQFRLARYQAELRAQGEKLTLAELHLPQPSPASNGAPAFLAATEVLNLQRTNCPLAASGVAALRMIAPGQAAVVFQRDRLLSPNECVSPQRPVERDWADLAAEIEQVVPVLAQVRTALQQPVPAVAVDHERWPEIQLSHLAAARAAARWLTSAATLELHRDDRVGTVSNIVAILRVAQLTAHDRAVISELVRWAIVGMAVEASWAALQSPGGAETELAHLAHVWQTPSFLDGMLAAVETERAMHLGYYAQLRKWPAWNQWRRSLLSAAQCGCGNRDLWFDLWMCGYSFWWRWAWLNHDEWRCLREAQAGVEQTRLIHQQGGPVRENKSAPIQVPIRNRYDAGRYFLSRMLEPSLAGFAAKALRQETDCQMLRTAIGIKRYELRHGCRPSDLAALVPEFLPELPRDQMDGQPLRYRLNVDGTFAVYSVGTDGVDNGGDPTSRSKSLARWQGRDAVWPQPVQ